MSKLTNAKTSALNWLTATATALTISTSALAQDDLDCSGSLEDLNGGGLAVVVPVECLNNNDGTDNPTTANPSQVTIQGDRVSTDILGLPAGVSAQGGKLAEFNAREYFESCFEKAGSEYKHWTAYLFAKASGSNVTDLRQFSPKKIIDGECESQSPVAAAYDTLAERRNGKPRGTKSIARQNEYCHNIAGSEDLNNLVTDNANADLDRIMRGDTPEQTLARYDAQIKLTENQIKDLKASNPEGAHLGSIIEKEATLNKLKSKRSYYQKKFKVSEKGAKKILDKNQEAIIKDYRSAPSIVRARFAQCSTSLAVNAILNDDQKILNNLAERFDAHTTTVLLNGEQTMDTAATSGKVHFGSIARPNKVIEHPEGMAAACQARKRSAENMGIKTVDCTELQKRANQAKWNLTY